MQQLRKNLSLAAASLTLAITAQIVPAPAYAGTESVAEFLRAFHADPAREMQRLPMVVEKDGKARSRGYIEDSAQGWESRISLRDEQRRNLIARSSPLAAPAEGVDNPEKLVEPGGLRRNIHEIHAAGLTHARLDPVPWTDSYWPLANGNTAARYLDNSFPERKDWQASWAYASSRPASSIVASGSRAEIDKLSPAEKYDYVMGDSGWTLTNYAWQTGRSMFEKHGRVPGWMGICHGWAAASHVHAPVPKEPVEVQGVNGPVTFYPQDVKALMSMLWANASPRVRFTGSRCNVPRPAKNNYGRVVDKACFDVNPTTLHLGLVNQLGIHKRSLIIDATYDVEVWNHPVAAYRFRYFNPQTWRESSTIEPSVIPLSSFKLDKFREFRSPGTASVVGIVMDVTYVVEINATRVPYDPVPPVKTLRFMYDLELDGAGNIIGGEWYTNAHPDFVWTFDKELQARTFQDADLAGDPWSRASPVPVTWTGPAASASRRGAPLATFVYRLSQ